MDMSYSNNFLKNSALFEYKFVLYILRAIRPLVRTNPCRVDQPSLPYVRTLKHGLVTINIP